MNTRGRCSQAVPFHQFVSRLSAHWQGHASILRRWGATAQAAAVELCASELEDEARAFSLESLSLGQAEEESGFTYSTLEKMVRSGRIPNAGSRGHPRIRRCDLPKKPGGHCESAQGEQDIAELVLAGKGSTSHIP